jgi:hypothetical protein
MLQIFSFTVFILASIGPRRSKNPPSALLAL